MTKQIEPSDELIIMVLRNSVNNISRTKTVWLIKIRDKLWIHNREGERLYSYFSGKWHPIYKS